MESSRVYADGRAGTYRDLEAGLGLCTCGEGKGGARRMDGQQHVAGRGEGEGRAPRPAPRIPGEGVRGPRGAIAEGGAGEEAVKHAGEILDYA